MPNPRNRTKAPRMSDLKGFSFDGIRSRDDVVEGTNIAGGDGTDVGSSFMGTAMYTTGSVSELIMLLWL